jgi:SAM-dependent methyltransferase
MASSFNGSFPRLVARKLSSLVFRMHYMRAKILDNLRGVDLTLPMSKEEAGIDGVDEAVYYGSTAFTPELNDALRYLNINGSERILDYGSGKGGVLVKLSSYPFKRICGVELSEPLVTICRRNLKKLDLRQIEVVNADATAFTDIDDFNYFYFANPFTGNIFRQVINNINVSLVKKPRDIYIIYYYPKCHDIIMESGTFKVVKEITRGARRINIYKAIH